MSDIQAFLDTLTPEIERAAREAFEGAVADVRREDAERIAALKDERDRLIGCIAELVEKMGAADSVLAYWEVDDREISERLAAFEESRR